MSIKKVPILESFTWQLPVKDKDLSAPPGSPTKGDRYIIAATGSGLWTGHTGDIALCIVGGGSPSWEFVTKSEGMTTWVEDENLHYKYNGSNWGVLDFVKNDGTVNPTNLFINGDFENWSAGVLSTYASMYPPAQNATYVKATTKYSTSYEPFFTTDPTKSLTGTYTDNEWLSENTKNTNQRFHIDLGVPTVIERIYYENGHAFGTETNAGAKNFTFWGSNSATSFAELTYGTDTGWTQITPAQSTFDQHVASDIADPKYITVTNTTAYRYYAFKFADNYGNASYIQIRRIELQQKTWNSPDGWALGDGAVAREATIIKSGTYSMKLSRVSGNSGVITENGYNVAPIYGKGIAYWQGRKVTFSCWVYATVASRARLRIYDGTTDTYSSYHTGGSTWELISLTVTINAAANQMQFQLRTDIGDTNAYFDGAMCVEGESAFAFADKPATPLYGTFVANGASAVTISDTRVAITDAIVISLNTVGGTVGVQPHVATITAGTGFTVVCTAGDTSTYNYFLLKR